MSLNATASTFSASSFALARNYAEDGHHALDAPQVPGSRGSSSGTGRRPPRRIAQLRAPPGDPRRCHRRRRGAASACEHVERLADRARRSRPAGPAAEAARALRRLGELDQDHAHVLDRATSAVSQAVGRGRADPRALGASRSSIRSHAPSTWVARLVIDRREAPLCRGSTRGATSTAGSMAAVPRCRCRGRGGRGCLARWSIFAQVVEWSDSIVSCAVAARAAGAVRRGRRRVRRARRGARPQACRCGAARVPRRGSYRARAETRSDARVHPRAASAPAVCAAELLAAAAAAAPRRRHGMPRRSWFVAPARAVRVRACASSSAVEAESDLTQRELAARAAARSVSPTRISSAACAGPAEDPPGAGEPLPVLPDAEARRREEPARRGICPTGRCVLLGGASSSVAARLSRRAHKGWRRGAVRRPGTWPRSRRCMASECQVAVVGVVDPQAEEPSFLSYTVTRSVRPRPRTPLVEDFGSQATNLKVGLVGRAGRVRCGYAIRPRQ